MTVTHDTDDAEFDAFLQGKGELAQLLKDVPQPQASPALDAAIMADVEKSLSAANDATMPEPKTGSYFSRWLMPLSFAASMVFAVMVSYQWYAKPIRGQTAAMALELSGKTATDAELAQAWLVKIEALLKAHNKQQAQDEWLKFQQRYPQYPVPDELKKALGMPPILKYQP